jgi:hypothetical protein
MLHKYYLLIRNRIKPDHMAIIAAIFAFLQHDSDYIY